MLSSACVPLAVFLRFPPGTDFRTGHGSRHLQKTKANLFCISFMNFIDWVEDFFWRRKHVTFPSEETSANPEALLFFPRLLVGRRSRHLPPFCPCTWAASPTSLCQLPGWRGFSQLLSVICPLFLQPALDPTPLSDAVGDCTLRLISSPSIF